jgi:hypothetical protein
VAGFVLAANAGAATSAVAIHKAAIILAARLATCLTTPTRRSAGIVIIILRLFKLALIR